MGVGNIYGIVFCVMIFGELYGGGVGCIIDGCFFWLFFLEEDM